MVAQTTQTTRNINPNELENALALIKADRSNDVSKTPIGNYRFYVEITRGLPVVTLNANLSSGGRRKATVYSDCIGTYSADPNYRLLRELLSDPSTGFEVEQRRHSSDRLLI